MSGGTLTMSKYTPEQRTAKFWERADKPDGVDGCWVWTVYVNKDGYGECKWHGRSPQLAHRVAFLLTHASLPKNVQVLQSCENKLCVNPSHLYILTNADRFWLKVDTSGGAKACWMWRGSTTAKGYGSFCWHGRIEHAQRVSFIIANGEFPRELHVLHTCDTPSCVNPAHLFLGTNQDNVDDKMNKGRHPVFYGEQHACCKLTDAQVAEIRYRYAAGGETHRRLGKEFGVSHNHIGRLVRDETRCNPPNLPPETK